MLRLNLREKRRLLGPTIVFRFERTCLTDCFWVHSLDLVYSFSYMKCAMIVLLYFVTVWKVYSDIWLEPRACF